MSLPRLKNLIHVMSTRRGNTHSQRRKLFAELLEDRTLLNATSTLQQAYGQLPLSFEVNDGQTAAQVQYLSHGSGYALFLTENSAVMSLTQASANTADSTSPPESSTGVALAMKLVGANPQATVAGLDQQSGTSNYFIGNDPSQWHTNIANYGKVEYQGVYPGINLVYYGDQQHLEYDFVVAPGADPSNIQLNFQGASNISLDAPGDLVQHAPVIYQNVGGVRQSVPGNFVLGAQGQVGFQVGAYNASLPLTIDPVLSYSTYLGGNNNDYATAIAVDGAGNAYVTGAAGLNFPTTTGAFQTNYGGSGGDAFVTKLNAAGTALIYSTYLGGSGVDTGRGIAVDGSGNAYVTGQTASANFPTTAGAFQTGHASDGSEDDAFVTELNAGGTALVYSTYLGGNNYDDGYGIAVDSSGNAYVTGSTQSSDFPTSTGAFQTSFGGNSDAFVSKLNASGSSLVYSTYLGASSIDYGRGIALDASGDAYVTGAASANFPTTAGAYQTTVGGTFSDAFVSKLNTSGTALIYSTFLGGNGTDNGNGIAVDSSGNAFVTGSTYSTNFPTTTGAFQTSYGGSQDAFVTKLNSAGSALIYSTYLGGNNEDYGSAIAVNAAGNAILTGTAWSSNFPTTPDAFQTSSGGGTIDAFVTEMNVNGTALAYSTYLGGNGVDFGLGIALDGSGNAYIAGETGSTNFPTTAGAYQTTLGPNLDAFIAKVDFAPPSIANVVINQDIASLYNAAGQPSPGTQRSMVNDIVYTFSEAVNIASPAVDPNVFTIAVASGWYGTVPTLSWAAVAGSSSTQWAVSFSGNGVTGGSIANGAYTITVTDPGAITAQSDDQALSLAGSGIGAASQSFYRLFGDINGDETVSAGDIPSFVQALTTYNAAFDYNQDGFVNAADNTQFKNDLRLGFSGFTPTI
jgi:Beta-propeller repeat/Dockerin type I domain